ncbi:MAG: glutamate 5-kinase [Elusimicrobia bacterium]|nr:glutamate 5-kinase [Candidatus Obscuribacterium magneticum]
MRLVLKIGSSVLSAPDGRLDPSSLNRFASQLAALHKEGHEVLVVTSGAIAAGVAQFAWKEKPVDLRLKQAAAAVGQAALMNAYQKALSSFQIIPAQVLLTREDFMNRQRYLNVRNTILKLLFLKTIPIINENDCVSTDEIQFGDNDSLSALVATKVEADKLIILSDVQGLLELDGEGRLTTKIIPVVERVTPELERTVVGAKASKMTVGGMTTKLAAAKMATAAGIEVWIASGHEPDAVKNILAGRPGAGTRFVPRPTKFEARHAWIAFGKKTKGALVIDDGALKAVVEERRSLLPSGIKKVQGPFAEGDSVGIKSFKGMEVARGLVNFSSQDIAIIKGHHSSEIASLLGRSAAQEVIHRDNLVIL